MKPTPDANDHNTDAQSSSLTARILSLRRELVTIHEVEPWLRFNRYIRRGYRPCGMTKTEALASLILYFHNETVNVLSHVFPCMLYIYWFLWPPVPTVFRSAPAPPPTRASESTTLLEEVLGGSKHNENGNSASMYNQHYHQALSSSSSSTFPSTLMSYLCLSFFFTFFLSAVYHLFMPCCRSQGGYQSLLQCDVFGVLVSITGSVSVYFTRGNRCVSSLLLSVCTATMAVSTVLTLYVLFIAPLRGSLTRRIKNAVALCCSASAAAVVQGVEWWSGQPMQAPHPDSEDEVVWKLIWAGRCRYHRWLRGESGKEGGSQAPQQQQHSDSPVPIITAAQRAMIVGCHCFLHFVCFALIVLPKSGARFGYSQSVFYHCMSYVCLMAGGIINSTRSPEKWFYRLSKRSRAIERKWAEERGEALCAEMLAEQAAERTHSKRNGRTTSRRSSNGGPSTINRDHSKNKDGVFCKISDMACWGVTNYLVGSGDLDLVGNSHNIWHVLTVMSTLCTLTGAYYDCVEYELMLC